MSEDVRMWVEILFNISYLVVVWGLVAMMWGRRARVAPADRKVAELSMGSFALLALGDTGHVGFRVWAYARGGLESDLNLFGVKVGLVGLGALATAITVTFFYVLMLFVWRNRFGKTFGWFEYVILAAPVVRFILMGLPANEWNNPEPVQPWSTWRNLPLMFMGLSIAFLILRDARKTQDRTFYWIGVMILVSYACYMPVIFFVQQAPLIGMLMIPKTMAYVAIAALVYRDLFRDTATTMVTLRGSAHS